MSISWPSRALTRRPFFVRTHPIRSALIFALSFRNPSIRAYGRTGQPGMKMSVATNVYAPLTSEFDSYEEPPQLVPALMSMTHVGYAICSHGQLIAARTAKE